MTGHSNSIISRAEETLKTLEDISQLPAIPQVLMEISQLFDMPDISVQKIANVVGKDQSLMLKVLSIANSPLYGLGKNVTSIDHAILVLGFQEIKSIVTSLKMISSVKMKSDEYFDQNKFWNHSLVVAASAQRMSKDLGFNFEGDSFVAGMLHDMGILIIHEFFPEGYKDIINYVNQNQSTFLDAEFNVLGLTHQQIGELLAERWSLPSVFTDALQFHHRPADSIENNYLTSILHIADYATSKFQIANILFDDNYILDESVIDLLNFLSPEEFDEFLEVYREDLVEAAKSQFL